MAAGEGRGAAYVRAWLATSLGAPGDVLERPGPAAAVVADAAILQRPRRDAGAGEGVGQLAAVGDVVLRQPAAAVKEDHHRMRAVAVELPVNRLLFFVRL